MRWVSLIVRPIIRLSAFLAAKALLILAVLAVSLSFSMATFVVPTLASAMWRAAAWVFGPPAIATVSETERLQQQIRELQQRNQHLARHSSTVGERNRNLSTRYRALEQENSRLVQVNRMGTAANQRLTSENRKLTDQLSINRRVTATIANRIGHRSVRSSTRSIAAIPFESVPVLGVTTIIATTAWEIRDTCETLDDMAEALRQLGQEPERGFAARACDLIPLQDVRVGYFGSMQVSECRASAEAARNRVFELAVEARAGVPDLLEDENDYEEETVQAAGEEFKAISAICDCIDDLICDPKDLIRR